MKVVCFRVFQSFFVIPVLLVTGCGSPEQRSQEYYDRGVALIEKKEDAAAKVELLNAVKFKGDKTEAWRALAGIDDRANAYQALFQDLRRLVELDPRDIDARIKLAKMLLSGNAPDAALRIVEGAGDVADQNSALHALKASILLKMKDISGGLLEAQRATVLNPGDVDAALLIASEKLKKGDVDAAMQILSAPPIASQNDARVDQIRSQVFAQRGDLGQAVNILHRLIEEKPKETSFRIQLARIYMAQRQFDNAEKELRSIVSLNPENFGAELDVVRFLGGTKGPAVARAELEARIKMGGDVFPYQMALADLDFDQGRSDDSVKLLEDLIVVSGSPEHILAAQTKLAEIYFRKANFSAAEKLVGDVLKKDVRNTAGLKVRASIRIEQGQFENAIADLREALNGQPKSTELLILMALAYERNGNLELAERQYADATKSAPGNPNIILQHAAFLRRQAKIIRAEEVLAEAARAYPRNIDILSALAQVRLARQDWVGALAAADSVQSIGSDRGVADLIRGAAFAGQNKVELSIAALEAAHASAPEMLQPIVSLVTAYLQTGKADKAELLLNEIQKKYPENDQLSLLMGSVQAAKNNIEEAARNFRSVVIHHPKDEAGYIALSNLYIQHKNYDQALKIIQEGLRELPDNLNFKLALAAISIETGDHDRAIAQYESILQIKPEMPIAINNLASLLLDYRTDKESFDRAYSLTERLKNSNVSQFQDTVGWAQYKRGDFDTAVSVLIGAQAKSPNVAAVRYHLGMSYMATGQTAKASDELNAAYKLEPEGSELKNKIRSALK